MVVGGVGERNGGMGFNGICGAQGATVQFAGSPIGENPEAHGESGECDA